MSDCYEIADEEMIKGLAKNEDIKTYIITEPCDEFPFLHEGAVIEFHGRLYMFINQMVSADHIHTLDLYVYNQTENKFERIRSKAIPFKLNTNVYKLPSGKLMICGRTGDLDGFPATPAVLISDSGKIDADWRIVKIQENEFLPDGRKFEHPETSAIICGNEIYVFCRNDYSDMPILYISRDEGETWSAPIIHNIPFYNSKIYSGMLSDGSVDIETAQKYVDWYFENGLDGIFAICQSSEIFYLSAEERVAINKAVYERAKPYLPNVVIRFGKLGGSVRSYGLSRLRPR